MSVFLFNNRTLPFVEGSAGAKPVWLVTKEDFKTSKLPDAVNAWASQIGFEGQENKFALVPGKDGQLLGAILGLGDGGQSKALIAGKLASLLPEGDWQIMANDNAIWQHLLGFGLGAYKFENYKSSSSKKPKVAGSETVDMADLERQIAASYLARDLINIPTNDMGPDALELAFTELGEHYNAKVSVIKGDKLLDQNFPLIHTVGRASAQEPRLLEMRWGDKSAPKVTLVGKGVCFDTGGLDIKPAAAMSLMKKDMGGAANILGLALMIMDAKLPVNLRVLIPAVENSISDNAFRPSDILTSRKGLTVQIDNTDAEGRLVLADALTYGCEEDPELIIDMATLTGAARVALGPDLPPYYTDSEDLASEILKAGNQEHDPVWRMPLYKGYEADVTTRISDLTNAPSGGFAGSITAALFLKRFVTDSAKWAHFDIYGWNPKERAHSPVGGEAQAIRTLYHVIKTRYSN